jgi:pyruvate,water dikinase
MKFILSFTQLNKGSVNRAGGKGASLGEMMSAGIPVPDGFVVCSEAFEHFMNQNGLGVQIDDILAATNFDDVQEVDVVSEKIRNLILNNEVPSIIIDEIMNTLSGIDCAYVAVRSSATAEDGAEHAWAGQLDSYLNSVPEEVCTNVQKCWSSLFTSRALFYRYEKGLLRTKISVAVVVQTMIDSEISGVAFSVHPVTQNPNQLIIEAGFGLGEAIVSGSITPDSYIVEKNKIAISSRSVSCQNRALYRGPVSGVVWKDVVGGDVQKLRDEQVIDLAKIILTIESLYKYPCDVEWAFQGGLFYIVQSRPITTLN